MDTGLSFSVLTTPFDEHYQPTEGTRLTTNFANLARGTTRQENLRNALAMMNNRFNTLVYWDNPDKNRYSIRLEIVSITLKIAGSHEPFPAMEMLKTHIFDHRTEEKIEGLVGNNFSSYLRDYDFSILLTEYNQQHAQFTVPEHFGDLHGNIFKAFINSNTYAAHFSKPPVICLSVSDNKTYVHNENRHPILGYEYQPSDTSLTEQYFQKMGMQVRYFMPPNSMAPFAFYFFGDLLNDYSSLELVSTISTMETFQRIYRPEIYNANTPAGLHYQPSLTNRDHSTTRVVYDRKERNRLAVEQGRFTETHLVKPYHTLLQQWLANQA